MILEDSLWRVCARLGVPAVVAMVLFGLNVIFDASFIGRYVGETAFAGVSVVYPLTQVTMGLGSLVGIGTGSLLSVLIGEEDHETLAKLLGNATTLILTIGAILTVLGLVSMDQLLALVGASGPEAVYAKSYLRISLFGAVFAIAGLAYNMVVRAEGKMSTAAMMMAAGLIVNIVTNYLFMGVFDFGVEGAAWATNIAMMVYAASFFVYALRGRLSFETKLFSLRFDPEIIKQILGLGGPGLIMSIMALIQGVIIMRALNTYGTTADVAFYGIVFRLFNLFLTPVFGLMRALQPCAGVNFGAKQYDRVIGSYKVFSFAAFLVMLPGWLTSFAAPRFMLSALLPDSTYTDLQVTQFRIFISIAPMLCVVMTALTLFPSIKNPKPAMILGTARQLVFYIPAMIILPKFWGITSIYVGSFIIDAFLTLMMVLLVRREFGRLRRLKAEHENELATLDRVHA